MTGIPVQPLEFRDFSGGITENILQGSEHRYAAADNFLITVDKKLTLRPGFIPIDTTNYVLPVGNQRVTNMFTCINESILMVQSARTIYTIDPIAGTWVSVLGPSSNETMGNGDLNSQNTTAEFQRQIYITNDGASGSNGTQPTRIYRNTSNVWVANTAGLPRAYTQGNYNNSTLLSKCLSLANTLRSSMISHFSDSRFSTYTVKSQDPGDLINLHVNIDKYSLNYLVAQTFVTGTDPEIPTGVTPAGAAVDQASLFLLTAALNNAYTHHMNDSIRDSQYNINSSPAPLYHPDMQVDPDWGVTLPAPRGPGVPLANNATPTTLVQTAAMLDDLVQKWYWHRFAVFTHAPFNDPVQMNRYGAGLTHIGTVTQGNSYATITPDISDILGYVNNLKNIYNNHVKDVDPSGGGNIAHKQPDNYLLNPKTFALQVNLLDCVDFDSMALLIFWLRSMYYLHQYDEQTATHRNITFTCTGSSAALTSVVLVATGAAYTIPVGYWLTSGATSGTQTGTQFNAVIGSSQPAGTAYAARVIASASGTATLDRQAAAGVAGATGQVSPARYHLSSQNITNSTYLDTTASVSGASSKLTNPATTVGGTDYASWLNLATDLFTALGNHANTLATHFQVFYVAGNVWPSLLTAGPSQPFFIPSAASYSYAFVFSHTYTVEPNGIQYLVQSNPVFSASTYCGISYPIGTTIATTSTLYASQNTTSRRTNVLTNLPSITNVSNTNYDTANIFLNIYRTTNGGTTYYLLAQVPNGTTTYSDITNDTLANPGSTALSTNTTIYTTGGVVGSDQPPQCKFIHILNGTTYYAGITDTGQYFPQRLRQSVQYAPDWVPTTFYDDMDDEITGLSSTRSNLIVFCRNSIYRESGGFNSQGQGALTHEKISDSLGCRNAKSIVRTEIGIFFAGSDGFYYTDGYQVINITLELKKTYALLTQTDAQVRSIFGNYDKITRRVWWAMKTSPTDTDNSVFYTFYLDYGVKPSGTFTTASNFNYVRPSSFVFQNGVMFMGHEWGYILKSDANTKTDAKVTVGVAASLWNTVYIPYNFTSAAVDTGTTFKRKWLTKAHLVGNNTGNAAIQLTVIRDMNSDLQGIKSLAPINFINNITWGTPICIWQDITQVWNNVGKMDLWRRFPATALRADFVQLQYTPAKIAVYASSVGYPLSANAVVDATAKTATIQTPSGYTSILWPNDVVDYVIAFQTDGYVNEFKITALDSTKKIVNFTDASNLSVTASGGVPWVIRGIKKEQRPTITSFVVHYGYLGDKTQAYPGKSSSSGGGNAGENPS